ncbi:ATP-binding protein [Aceticella autotrophica]|uniref:Mg-protoporphyrin IX chelatase n=2 Tax=Aceticella autotrophica TaxID=2755338 RepID=A0A975GB64_9THEO|nr:ATP-binding protein [Aceticella autotrophica]
MRRNLYNMYYPFCAIVGQEKMKKALILNVVNTRLCGVLIRGEKGTAKSTAVRALAELLPEIKVVEGCPFGCDPENPALMCKDCREKWEKGEKLPAITRKMRVIDLPISATEDRVVGTIDIEKAIKKGEKSFEPGVLAEANRGILYVDEVNLLDDHVVDILLDSAAMGVNIVEREGVSYSHPANFILVGTMNPEEGDLRPQLLDRFGLCVTVEGIEDPKDRVEIIKNTLAFEEDPAKFSEKWEEKQEELRQKIVNAKKLLPKVKVDDEMLELIAHISLDMGVDGHRADIIMMKTASTIAAYKGKDNVTEEDVKEAAELVLPHRMRKKPFQQSQMDQEKLEQTLKEQQQQKQQQKQQQEKQQQQKQQEKQQREQQQEPDGDDKKKLMNL